MDKLERIQRLTTILDVLGGEIKGRKKFHKLVYLTQRKGINLGQDFIFHHYGVYSPSLSMDIDHGKRWDFFSEEQEGNTYRLKNKKNEKIGEEKFSNEDIEIIKKLAKESAPALEVLSTIVYLYDCGYKDEVLLKKLDTLKGHLKAYFSKAKKLAEEYYEVEI